MAAWRYCGFSLTGEHAELPESVAAAAGSWNLFSVLGVPMALGRSFTPQEDQLGASHVVILTWSLYQRRFHGDPSILGKQIRVDTLPYIVVGVLPRWFTYPDARMQLWVPYASTFTPDVYFRHDFHQSYVIARLRPGTSAAAAVKPVSAIQYRMHLANLNAPVAEDAVTRPMIDDVVHDIKTSLIVLLCAVGCMLLIACLNISNLLVARGARRAQVLRLVLIDGLRPVFIGLILGVGGGIAAGALIRSLLYGMNPLDPTVFAVMIGCLLLTAVIACVIPAIRASHIEPVRALRSE